MAKRLIVPTLGIVVLVIAAVLYVSLALPVYERIDSLNTSIAGLRIDLSEAEAVSYSMDDLVQVNQEVADFDYKAYEEVRNELYEFYSDLFNQATDADALAFGGEEIGKAIGLANNPNVGVFSDVDVVQTIEGKYYALVSYERDGGPRGILSIYSRGTDGALVLEDVFKLLV